MILSHKEKRESNYLSPDYHGFFSSSHFKENLFRKLQTNTKIKVTLSFKYKTKINYFLCFPNLFLVFQLMVYNDGELVNGCPYYFRVLPPLTKIKSPGMDPCAIGSIVEVLVNSYGTCFW